LSTSGTGSIPLPFVTPAGLPTGFVFFTQYAIKDNAAINHVALSNALKAVVPAPGPVITSFAPHQGPAGTPLTLNGVGFATDPAAVVVSVGGLLPTPTAGSPNQWTGILPVIPQPDILAEAIQVVVGSGQKVGSGPTDF